jgi:hypothetical protein
VELVQLVQMEMDRFQDLVELVHRHQLPVPQ